MDLASKREFTVLVVIRFDRLAIGVREVLWYLEDLGARGIDFASVEEGFDSTNPKTGLIYTALVTLAKLEREMFIECVPEGKESPEESSTSNEKEAS